MGADAAVQERVSSWVIRIFQPGSGTGLGECVMVVSVFVSRGSRGAQPGEAAASGGIFFRGEMGMSPTARGAASERGPPGLALACADAVFFFFHAAVARASDDD